MAALPNQFAAQSFDPFIHFIDEYGIRHSRQKGTVFWYRDDGAHRTVAFSEYHSTIPAIVEFKVRNTYEDLQKQMGKS